MKFKSTPLFLASISKTYFFGHVRCLFKGFLGHWVEFQSQKYIKRLLDYHKPYIWPPNAISTTMASDLRLLLNFIHLCTVEHFEKSYPYFSNKQKITYYISIHVEKGKVKQKFINRRKWRRHLWATLPKIGKILKIP